MNRLEKMESGNPGEFGIKIMGDGGDVTAESQKKMATELLRRANNPDDHKVRLIDEEERKNERQERESEPTETTD